MPTAVQLYLDLVKRAVLNQIYQDRDVFRIAPDTGTGYRGTEVFDHDAEARALGNGWPMQAHSMIGVKRLDNIQECVSTILADGVPGDLIETGVWRGGACIFMRAMLAAHEVTDRKVWVADSFEGMPVPDGDSYPADEGWDLTRANTVLGVPEEHVRDHFDRYGLLDGQVEFLKGWFRDTLPAAPIDRLAYLRLDGDLYESTMDALVHLYPKLSPGGFVTIDDYALEPCKLAVEDYRTKFGIDDEIVEIDWSGVYWRKSA